MSTSDTVASPSPVRNDTSKRVQPNQASGRIPPQPGALQQLESQGQDGNRSSNPTLTLTLTMSSPKVIQKRSK